MQPKPNSTDEGALLGAQGDATKIRLAVPADPADPESFGLWMSAIDDLANETTRATIDFTRR